MDEDGSEWPDIDMEGDGFKRLLQELEGYIVGAAGKSFLAQDELRLTVTEAIHEAIQRYVCNQFTAFDASQRSLHEIAAPLARVIELLKHVPNQPQIFFALNGKTHHDGYMDLEYAVERYEALLGDLDKIAVAVPPIPRRGRGRPSRKHLPVLVWRLADCWVHATGKRFTQDWRNGEPLTIAAQFVRAVVDFVDPESLGALPKVTERVITARHAVTPQK